MARDSAVQQIAVQEGVRCRNEAIGVSLVTSNENRIGLAMFKMTPVTVGVPPARAANEAAVITEAAIGLASQTIDPFTRALISGIGRGELTGDQAVKAIVSRWTPTSIRDQASV